MIVKNLLRNLSYEIVKRDNVQKFTAAEFYFPTEEDEIENLDVGETFVSITAQLRPE